MQELVISILLTVVIIMAAVLLVFVGSRKDGMTKKQRVMMIRILISAGILLALQFVSAEMFDMVDSYLFPSAGRWIRFACYLINYFIIGYDILRKAAKGIRNRQVFDESFLMAVATIGAMALAIYENGDYLEAIAVMLFYQIGEWFQGYAVGKSRRNISNLMDIRPDYANVERNGKLEQVDPDEVGIGSVIVVQPGEKVPIDGNVVEGVSSLNTSALTGESLPREAKVGDEVISGCISMTGVFLDTAVVCTITGLAFAVSGVLSLTDANGAPLTGTALTLAAFSTVLGDWGNSFVSACIVLFAFATVIGWAYQGERAFEYLLGGSTKYNIWYRFIYGLTAFVGCVCPLEVVWNFSDICNGLMAVPNLICVLALSGSACREIRAYCTGGSVHLLKYAKKELR